MSKPRVDTRCIANHYAGPNERIVEFGAGSADTGGLISLRMDDTGALVVAVYATSGRVAVTAEPGLLRPMEREDVARAAGPTRRGAGA